MDQPRSSSLVHRTPVFTQHSGHTCRCFEPICLCEFTLLVCWLSCPCPAGDLLPSLPQAAGWLCSAVLHVHCFGHHAFVCGVPPFWSAVFPLLHFWGCPRLFLLQEVALRFSSASLPRGPTFQPHLEPTSPGSPGVPTGEVTPGGWALEWVLAERSFHIHPRASVEAGAGLTPFQVRR